MRHHHSRRGPRHRVQPQEDVGFAQRHHPEHPGGTIFRAPIVISNIPRLVPGWTKPIIIGRHAFGDQYRATNFKVDRPGTVTLTFTPRTAASPWCTRWCASRGRRVVMGMCNQEVHHRLRAVVVQLRLQQNYPVYPVDQEHHPQAYDGLFKDEFQRIFDEEYKDEFDKRGLTYEHRLIDDMVVPRLKRGGRLCLA